MKPSSFKYILKTINGPDIFLTEEQHKHIVKSIAQGTKIVILESTGEAIMTSSISGFYLIERIDHGKKEKEVEDARRLAGFGKWRCKCGNVVRNEDRCHCASDKMKSLPPFQIRETKKLLNK